MKQQPEMKERFDGTCKWRLPNGLLHREDGPAIERPNGYRAWWIRGLLHREDGPAVEAAAGTRVWCQNGQRHREDGPAVERADGSRQWWIRGQELTEEEFNAYRFRVWAVEGRLIDAE